MKDIEVGARLEAPLKVGTRITFNGKEYIVVRELTEVRLECTVIALLDMSWEMRENLVLRGATIFLQQTKGKGNYIRGRFEPDQNEIMLETTNRKDGEYITGMSIRKSI